MRTLAIVCLLAVALVVESDRSISQLVDHLQTLGKGIDLPIDFETELGELTETFGDQAEVDQSEVLEDELASLDEENDPRDESALIARDKRCMALRRRYCGFHFCDTKYDCFRLEFYPSKECPDKCKNGTPKTTPSRGPHSHPSRGPWTRPSRGPRPTRPSRGPHSHPSRGPWTRPSRGPWTRPSRGPRPTRPSRGPWTRRPRPTRSDEDQVDDVEAENDPQWSWGKGTRRPWTLPSRRPWTWPSRRPWTLPSRRPWTWPSRRPWTLPSRRPWTWPSRKPHTHGPWTWPSRRSWTTRRPRPSWRPWTRSDEDQDELEDENDPRRSR